MGSEKNFTTGRINVLTNVSTNPTSRAEMIVPKAVPSLANATFRVKREVTQIANAEKATRAKKFITANDGMIML